MSDRERLRSWYSGLLQVDVAMPPAPINVDGLTLLEYDLPSGEVQARTGVGQLAVHLALRGRTRLRRLVDGRWEEASLGSGAVTLSPPGYWSCAEWTGAQRRFSVYLTDQAFARLSGDAGVSLRPSALRGEIVIESPVLRHTLCVLRAKFRDGSQGHRSLSVEAFAAALCVDLADRRRRVPGVLGVRGGLSPRTLAVVCESLASSLAEGLPPPFMASLAVLAGLSPAHLCRAFVASTRMPPHRWLVERRVEQASELLGHSALPVGEVALRVGYDDPAYFARVFKRATGVAPLAYRREVLS